jgi:HSP20 family protein
VHELWSWEPFEDVRRLQRQMGRLFSDAWPFARRAFPPVNVWTGRDNVIVTAALPGLDPAKLDLTVVGDTLTLNGEREAEPLTEEQSLSRQERETGTFSRAIQLPYRVDPDKVEARYAKGILRIDLPRLEADKPKQIAVKANA